MEQYSKSRPRKMGLLQILKKQKKRIILQCDQRLRNVLEEREYELNIKTTDMKTCPD